jgi:hypothetical protein
MHTHAQVLTHEPITLLKMHHLPSNPATNATQLHDALTSVSELLHVVMLDLSQIIEKSIVFANSLLVQLIQLTMVQIFSLARLVHISGRPSLLG